MSAGRTFSLAMRGLKNFLTGKPLTISFEVTYRCNARCHHCHLGGPIPNEKQATPEEFGRLCRTFKPVVAQVSGGEPTLRRDLEDIIRAMRRPGKHPFIVLTTNAATLTRERYESLRAAGVDEFSISFDYPDERHDTFREIPGLFKKIESLLESIQDIKDKGITLSCVVHRQNFRELIKMAEFAKKWGVGMNYSTYTWMRTSKKDEFMITPEEMPEFKQKIDELLAWKEANGTVFTAEYNFRKMIEFFETQAIGGCRAGQRFMIIGPDGSMSPCGLIIKNFATRKEMIREFSKKNDCTACFTSIRANSEKNPSRLIKDNLHKVFGRKKKKAAQA
ncbi:MAG TPA: radical SAM protein [Spirochaetota bacterium]|nr:radical SAM protein [Spirochaetota bacterium]